MGCGCGGKSFKGVQTRSVRAPSTHSGAAAQRQPTQHQPAQAPPQIVQSAALQQRRSAAVRRQV